MRFTYAWSQALSQNVTLRFAVACLSSVTIVLLALVMKLSLKDSVVVERGCYSEALEKVSPEHTPQEIKAFLIQAIHQRFDWDGFVQDGFLSGEEAQYRDQEQRELLSKQMKQRVIFNQQIKVEGNQISIDADRIISVGPVRSAFSFPVIATIASVKRTNGNPYGLKLIKVVPINNEKKNEK